MSRPDSQNTPRNKKKSSQKSAGGTNNNNIEKRQTRQTPEYSENTQNIHWYPGHMTKTRRQMEQCIKLVDGVVEIIDARIPMSSRNPEIDSVTAHRPRIILLNKADIADSAATSRWISYFSAQGAKAISCDCKTGRGLNHFADEVRKLLADKIAQWEAKGMGGRSIRLMIVGIPNVGKSSFINRMAKGGKAKVADRPGVTRGNQWFTIGGGIELLDTPGVLWPKFDDPDVGRKLAFTGAVNGKAGVQVGVQKAWDLCERYKLESLEGMPPLEVMEQIARNRGMIMRGGDVDYERVSVMLMDEYRAGRLGRITLELPE